MRFSDGRCPIAEQSRGFLVWAGASAVVTWAPSAGARSRRMSPGGRVRTIAAGKATANYTFECSVSRRSAAASRRLVDFTGYNPFFELGQMFLEFGGLKRPDKSIYQLGDFPGLPGVRLPLATALRIAALAVTTLAGRLILGRSKGTCHVALCHPIEDASRRRHVADPRGGQNSIDDIFGVVLHEFFGQQRRLVARPHTQPPIELSSFSYYDTQDKKQN